jgi:hypothetical protein
MLGTPRPYAWLGGGEHRERTGARPVVLRGPLVELAARAHDEAARGRSRGGVVAGVRGERVDRDIAVRGCTANRHRAPGAVLRAPLRGPAWKEEGAEQAHREPEHKPTDAGGDCDVLTARMGLLLAAAVWSLLRPTEAHGGFGGFYWG